jgi:predicted DNA-binding transcriptional regulator AlpA
VAAAPRYAIPKNIERALAQLADSSQVAEILGLSSGAKGLASYVSDYDDFPPPVQVGDSGRCARWYIPHVHQWREMHPARRRAGDRPDGDGAK